jgi:glycosyltransferase involved in cell wall biosynthesis
VARRRVIVYYPTFATIGGGEKQALATAVALAGTYDVELCGESVPSAPRLLEAFGLDASAIELTNIELGPVLRRLVGHGSKARRVQQDLARWSHARWLRARSADLIFRVEHLRPPPLSHPSGVYSCLFPFADETNDAPARAATRAYLAACRALERALFGDRRRSLATWSGFVANSGYTAGWMLRLWGARAVVISPPCDDVGPALQKQPWILSVGRFEPDTNARHSKSQHVLIAAFRRLRQRYDGPCELHLAGHAREGPASRAYVDGLRRSAEGLPVHFHLSIERGQLVDLYRRSSVFWQATGYGYDPERFPGKQEHFGIATVEAMSAGAVPVLYRSGGSLEIIDGQGFGALWATQDELVSATIELLADNDRRADEAARAVTRAIDFRTEAYMDAVRAMVDDVVRTRGDAVTTSPVARAR